MLISFGILSGLASIGSTSAQAQITFAWDGTPPAVTSYRTIEDCLGVVQRVMTEEGVVGGMTRFQVQLERTDTLPRELRNTFNSTPQPVITTAASCSEPFSVDSILQTVQSDIALLESAFRLLLLADRVPDAMTLAQRWFGALPAGSDTLRSIVTERLAIMLLDSRPTRFDAAAQLVETFELPRFWLPAIDIMANVMREAERLNDTVRMVSTAQWLIRLPSIVGENILRSPLWRDPRRGRGKHVIYAQNYLHVEEILEKLRESTDAYEEYLTYLRKEAGFHDATKLPSRKAKPIIADWWFPARPDHDLPTSGKVSIVASSTSSSDCSTCQAGAAELRRLHAQFPEIEIIQVHRTHETNGRVREPFPSPEAEAYFLDTLYRQHVKMPIILAVENAKFWRLPDPDRRRVDEPGPNHDWLPTVGFFGASHVVDREGNLLSSPPGVDLRLFLDVLVRRPKQ